MTRRIRAAAPLVTALRRVTSATSRATRALAATAIVTATAIVAAVAVVAIAAIAVAKNITNAGTIFVAKATSNKQQATEPNRR